MDGSSSQRAAESDAGAIGANALGGSTTVPGVSLCRHEQQEGLHLHPAEDLRQPVVDGD
jgi:hypothetical protein